MSLQYLLRKPSSRGFSGSTVSSLFLNCTIVRSSFSFFSLVMANKSLTDVFSFPLFAFNATIFVLDLLNYRLCDSICSRSSRLPISPLLYGRLGWRICLSSIFFSLFGVLSSSFLATVISGSSSRFFFVSGLSCVHQSSVLHFSLSANLPYGTSCSIIFAALPPSMALPCLPRLPSSFSEMRPLPTRMIFFSEPNYYTVGSVYF